MNDELLKHFKVVIQYYLKAICETEENVGYYLIMQKNEKSPYITATNLCDKHKLEFILKHGNKEIENYLERIKKIRAGGDDGSPL